jgi:hypothetical protein
MPDEQQALQMPGGLALPWNGQAAGRRQAYPDGAGTERIAEATSQRRISGAAAPAADVEVAGGGRVDGSDATDRQTAHLSE